MSTTRKRWEDLDNKGRQNRRYRARKKIAALIADWDDEEVAAVEWFLLEQRRRRELMNELTIVFGVEPARLARSPFDDCDTYRSSVDAALKSAANRLGFEEWHETVPHE